LSGLYHVALGLVYSHSGSSEQTVANAEAAITQARRCGDTRTEGRAQYVLCRDTFWSSRLRDSVKHGLQGAALLASSGDRWWEGHCHCFLSLTFCQAGELDRAIDSTARGGAIAESMGDQRLLSYHHWNVGLIEATRLNVDLAIAAARRGLELSPDPLNSAFASGVLGLALIEAGEPADALRVLQRATDALFHFGVHRTAGWFEVYQAEALLRGRDLRGAREQALQALATTVGTGHRWAVGVAQRVLGRTALAAGDLDEARDRLVLAVDTFGAIGARLDLGVSRLDLARCVHEQGRPEHAEALLRLARTDLSTVAAPRWLERLDELAVEVAPLLSSPSP
jgi:tetratricopeptide (TPR) repeat protein